MTFKWYETNLSKLEEAKYIPFLSYFDKLSNEDIKTYQKQIDRIEHWMENLCDKGRGLVLVGTYETRILRSHLLYLVAINKDMKISLAQDAMQELSRDSEIDVKSYCSQRRVIDMVGDEENTRFSPLKGIIYEQWRLGSGVVISTSLTADEIRLLYGKNIFTLIEQSCEIVKF